MKERADRLVVSQGLADSRQKAQALIMAGLVFSRDGRIEKSGQLLDRENRLSLKEKLPFVSRGGLKLNHALERFNIPVSGRQAIDLGASTGGFTDCLLQHGASLVYAVDVDPRQLDWGLMQDPRVFPIKKNARYIEPGDFPGNPDLVTMDLSFISVLKVLPAVRRVLIRGDLIALIKPQFEAGKGQVGKKGIIRDPRVHEDVLRRMTEASFELDFMVRDVTKSGVRGQKGNQEFFLHWTPSEKGGMESGVPEKIKEAVWNESDS